MDIDKLLEEAEAWYGCKGEWVEPTLFVYRLAQAVRELRESNQFLSEAIDEAIKDRDYYEQRHREINLELGQRESQVQSLLLAINKK